MGFAAGLSAGMGAVERGLAIKEAADRRRAKKAIAAELTKDYSSELTDLNEAAPSEIKARVAQGEQEAAAAVRDAADAMAPAQPAQFNMTQPAPVVAPAPAPAPAPAARVGGLQIPKMGSGYAPPASATTALQGDVMSTAAEGAKVTPGQAADELRTETKRTVVNPMQDYLRYQGAAAKAAELGDLELQKAYSDMAAANFKTGILKTAGEALKALDQGDTKLLEYTLTKFVPNGLKYTNGKVNEDKSVTFDLVGAKGETNPVTVSRDQIMQTAYMMAEPANIMKLYEANMAAQAEAAKYKRDRADKKADKIDEREWDWKKITFAEQNAERRSLRSEAGANARFNAGQANANARTQAQINASNIRAERAVGRDTINQFYKLAGDNSIDLDSQALGLNFLASNPGLSAPAALAAARDVRAGTATLQATPMGTALVGNTKVKLGSVGTFIQEKFGDETGDAAKYLQSYGRDMAAQMPAFFAAQEAQLKRKLTPAEKAEMVDTNLSSFGPGAEIVATVVKGSLGGAENAKSTPAPSSKPEGLQRRSGRMGEQVYAPLGAMTRSGRKMEWVPVKQAIEAGLVVE